MITMKAEIILSLVCVILILSTNYVDSSSCFRSIISFGDSLTDTGNKLHLSLLSAANSPPHYGKPPYGVSYFQNPTGRCSDGRLVIDFIGVELAWGGGGSRPTRLRRKKKKKKKVQAEYLGLQYVEPYVGNQDYRNGVNFAMVGATALGTEFFMERGFDDPFTSGSLDVQLYLCKTMLASLPPKASHDLMKNSLIVMGEIGGNDYNHALLAGRSIREVQTFMRPVVNEIGYAITELIELGAVSFLVPGYLPIGCSASYLAMFERTSSKYDFDPVTGCINWLNNFAQKHNRMLRTELNRIQLRYPHTTIIYGDFYNAAMPFYRAPKKHGFVTAIIACCGGGGRYNYNASLLCGDAPSSSCENPSTFANWDGLHLTDAGNRIVTKNLFEGPNTFPRFKHSCASKSSG